MIRSALIVAALLLSGCGSNTERGGFDLARSYFSTEDYTPPPRFTALFNTPRPVLDIELIDLGVAGKLILEQQDGDYARYLGADLGGIILQNGMLHSIYGFGEPMAGSELSQPRALLLAGRAGKADRFHTYVSGEDRVISRTYRCDIAVQGARDVELTTGTVATTLMSESCKSPTNAFENLYWVDRRRGEIIQSRQWVGENIGSMVTRVTLP